MVFTTSKGNIKKQLFKELRAMKRTGVINGKKVQVSPYKVFETSYGLKFSLKEPACLSSSQNAYRQLRFHHSL